MKAKNESPEGSQPKKPAATNKDVVKVEPAVARQLEAQAAKLSITKSKYASAAIAYFTQNSLDPTAATGPQEGHLTRLVLGGSIQKGREETLRVGNTLLNLMRAWESQLYHFQHAQQVSLFAYLEKIEANILTHQLAVEKQVLSTMLEYIVSTELKAHKTRALAEGIFAKVYNRSPTDLVTMTRQHEDEHTIKLMRELEQLAKKIAVPTPTQTPKEKLPAKPLSALVVKPRDAAEPSDKK